jgi:N-methylhydantoinase A/oxoprolinase/acetone carboxylase beta subunit
VYDAAQLRVGDVIDRPAIVEEESTTIVVFPAGR